MSRLLMVDPLAHRLRSGMLENRVLNPSGGSGATNWSVNTAAGTLEQGPALGDFTTSARFTRTVAGAWRLGATASIAANTLYTLRMELRASTALTSVVVAVRPNVTTTTGQAVLGTVTIPEGESVLVLSGTTTSTAPVAAAGVTLTLSSGAVGVVVDAVASLTRGADDPGVIISGSWKWARWTGSAMASTSLGFPGLVRP